MSCIKYLDVPYSVQNYQELIHLLRDTQHEFSPFTLKNLGKKSVFLRHDIDYSLDWALKWAQINHDLEVAGTFFIQLRSPLYNVFDPRRTGLIKQIEQLGQHLAFHVALHDDIQTKDQALKLVQDDFHILKQLLPNIQPVIAWHNPSIVFEKDKSFMSSEIEGFVNAYGMIAGQKIPYYSDSNLRYSVQEFKNIIMQNQGPMQLALAPMQWLPGKSNMISILAECMAQNMLENEQEYILNHCFREAYPEGLPPSFFENLKKELIYGQNSMKSREQITHV